MHSDMTVDSMPGSARILLIDDHPAVRQGLALLLSLDHHQVCGEAGNRQEMLQQLATCRADLALLDLSLGSESGLDLIDDLRQWAVPVLVYSFREDADTIRRVFSLGAAGYVTKREVASVLLNAVREVLDGHRHMSPFVAQSLADSVVATPQAVRESLLSEREQQIIDLLGQGCGNQEIGERLAISVRTVESYCSRACEKLGLSGMKELRRHAIQSPRQIEAAPPSSP